MSKEYLNWYGEPLNVRKIKVIRSNSVVIKNELVCKEKNVNNEACHSTCENVCLGSTGNWCVYSLLDLDVCVITV